MAISLSPQKPKVYKARNLFAQPGGRKPFSEVRWCCWYPHLTYPDSVATFDTWEEAMKAANSYRPPMMMNQTSGNTFTYTHTLPWINDHKWG